MANKTETEKLGYMNGWSSETWKRVGPILDKCKLLKHEVSTLKEGNCLKVYSCSVCNYEYLIDSSD